MKMRSVILLMALALLATEPIFGQMADKADISNIKGDYLGLKPTSKPFSLIDLSKLTWSNSYTFSYFSGGGTSGSIGVYTGLISYEFSKALKLGLKIGVAHNPSALINRQNSSDATFLPGLALDYAPSKNFHLSIGINSYYGPGLYQNDYYGNQLWRLSR
jgi:hypothetical protein